MKTLLLLPIILFSSCGAFDAIVDTTEAVGIAPDVNGDGIPDKILVRTQAVSPVVSQSAVDKLVQEANQKLEDLVVKGDK